MDGFPRAVRPVQDPLGLYFRVCRNDHSTLLLRLQEDPTISGAVLDASYEHFHEDLRRELREKNFEAVLDPSLLELATLGGFERPRLQRLPWAGRRKHTPDDLAGGGGLELADTLAKHVTEKGYSAVLSPSHYIEGPDDPWFDIDCENTARLRRYLDATGGESVPIYYLLALPAKKLRDAALRRDLIAELAALEGVDALWLRVHPFGNDAGWLALQRYIGACQDFHQTGLPIIADRAGSTGLPLLAFGAVGGIVAGMTIGEKFDAGALERPLKPEATPYLPGPRVYVEPLGAFLSKEQARKFFAPENRTHARFGCRERRCCPNGVADMIDDPRRHYFNSRVREVTWLGSIPPSARSKLYMEERLRPATDKAVRAAAIDPSLMRIRKQIDGWRDALGRMEESGPPQTFARVPKGRRIRRRTRSSA
jgi:hypothetical protein